MKRAISSFILRLFGWTVEVDVPDYPKCVICVAPHTSNWDFFIGKLAYLSIGRYAGFMMKKSGFSSFGKSFDVDGRGSCK